MGVVNDGKGGDIPNGINSINDAFAERKRKLTVLKNMRRPSGRESGARIKESRECPACQTLLDCEYLEEMHFVCENCGFHLKLAWRQRVDMIFDQAQYLELFADILPSDPINFPGYEQKLAEVSEKTGLSEACTAVMGKIGGIEALCMVLDSDFLMGSMGTAVGEKIALGLEYAARKTMPVIIFSASGGARMQEGIFSLMQMAKTAAAVKRFSDRGGLFISYLTHPTTGGVTASFASLGDIILAEPGALIGFAGPRVIEQTIKEKLPSGFQRAEFLLGHGFVDAIISRASMRKTLRVLLSLHAPQGMEYGTAGDGL